MDPLYYGIALVVSVLAAGYLITRWRVPASHPARGEILLRIRTWCWIIAFFLPILLTPQPLPSLLLAIVIVAILGPGLMNAMLAVAVVVLPHYVRITRAAVLAETARDYVTAARLAGAGRLRLMFIEVLPNCAAPLIVQASLGVSTAILDAAALGFLGLGAQPPAAEWGTMLADAREFVLRAWWVVTFPGLMILVTVLAFNLLGDGLRDALDPKLKR